MGYMLERAIIERAAPALRRQGGRLARDPGRRRQGRPGLPEADQAGRPVLLEVPGPAAGPRRRSGRWSRTPGGATARSSPRPGPSTSSPSGIIRELVEAGRIVIAAGGGGIPVIINGNGLFEGVEAVIDKDYAASLLAREVKVDLFVILTAIERVYINFGKPDQAEVPVLTVDEARRHLADGQFPPGSMGPKIRAAVEYIEAGGREVLITKDTHLKAALLNRSGTRIVAAT